VTNASTIEYLTSSPELRDGIVFLVGSLGGRVTWQAKATHYTKGGVRHPCREAYRMIISFSNGVVPVSSVKHTAKYKFGGRRLSERYIASVEPSRRALCRCIAVSAPDRLYVTSDFIVTHNTSWVMQMIENVAALTQPNGAPIGVIMFSMEMKRRQLLMRSMARRCGIPFRNLRLGRLQPQQWTELVEQSKIAKTVPMIIDDGRGLTPYRLRSKLRRHLAELRNKFGSELKLGAFAIDYIQLMNANDAMGGNDNRANELGAISKDLKQQAGELDATAVALSSLKRPDNKVKVPKPQMTDLRESGALDFDADVIMMLHRDDSYRDKHEPKDHLADLIVCKSRNSDTSTHITQFDGRVYGFYPHDYVLFPETQQQELGQSGEWYP
jgi:replicative DNA helicase